MIKASDFLNEFHFSEVEFNNWIAAFDSRKTAKRAKKILELVDLTTLSSTDSISTVTQLLNKAEKLSKNKGRVPAVCVFPNFCPTVKQHAFGDSLHLAVVAGAFPLGQADQKIKLKEVEYAIVSGAEEIDFVINRGLVLNGDLEEALIEIRSARLLCEKKAELKVIIETSDLKSPENVYLASRLALEAGADFIKTSTGKGEYGARPQDAWVMCMAIHDFYKQTGELRGLKVAGGIRTLSDANIYYEMVKHFFGKPFCKPHLFRIGASSLVDDLVKHIG